MAATNGTLPCGMNAPAESLQRIAPLPIAMLSLALITVPLLVLAPEALALGFARCRSSSEVVNGENDALRRDVTRLRVEVRRLQARILPPWSASRATSSEMVRKNEVVFQFPKP